MEAPGITRQRRPFLAPIWLFALIILLAFGVLLTGYRSLTTTTIIVTRHAERVLGTIADAPLTPEGEQRAQQLARTFGAAAGPARVAAIYVVGVRSASMTAAPLASRLGIQPTTVQEPDLQGLASRLLRMHRGRSVLVVARADTVMQMARALTDAKLPPIGENDYGSAYVISVPSIGHSSVLEIKY